MIQYKNLYSIKIYLQFCTFINNFILLQIIIIYTLYIINKTIIIIII